MPNPHAARRIRERTRKEHRLKALCDRVDELETLRRSLLAALRHPRVVNELELFAEWRELRDRCRALRQQWIDVGGLALARRVAIVEAYAHEGTVRERAPLVKRVRELWSNPPQIVIQDTWHADIFRTVRSLKLRSRGSSPYEYKRLDHKSVDSMWSGNGRTNRQRVRILSAPSFGSQQTSATAYGLGIRWYTDEIAKIRRGDLPRAVDELEYEVRHMLPKIMKAPFPIPVLLHGDRPYYGTLRNLPHGVEYTPPATRRGDVPCLYPTLAIAERALRGNPTVAGVVMRYYTMETRPAPIIVPTILTGRQYRERQEAEAAAEAAAVKPRSVRDILDSTI
jgi:hypothetical protein